MTMTPLRFSRRFHSPAKAVLWMVLAGSLLGFAPASLLPDGNVRGSRVLKKKQERQSCSDDPEEFCRSLGGEGAIPRDGRDCYNDFNDCECDSGFEENDDQCEEEEEVDDSCSDNPERFCRDLGGKGAIPRDGKNCYDTWDDCECADGFEEEEDQCEEEEEEQSSCSDDPEEFCIDLGGEGAIPIEGKDCYDTWDDCECDDGFEEEDDQCEEEEEQSESSCSDDPEQFCIDLGGEGAIPRDERDCYDTWDDCECADGFEEEDDQCEELPSACGDDALPFCIELGGEGAIPKQGVDCVSSFDDCECDDGFEEDDDQCVEEAPSACGDDALPFCIELGGEGAIPKQGVDCVSSFDDCECSDGFEEEDDQCEEEDDGCSNNPAAFCRGEGGDGAYPSPDSDCVSDFDDDCSCFLGWVKSNSNCVFAKMPVPSSQLQHTGNDGFPSIAFPLDRCQGDCDDDEQCGDSLVCFQRDGDDAVPGCDGGEDEDNDYDYCVNPCDISPPPISCQTSSLSPSAETGPTPLPVYAPVSSPSTPLPVPVSSPAPATPAPNFGFLISRPPTPPSDGDTVQIQYVGRFQQVEEASCSFPHPKIVAGCSGGQITLSNVSDPSIVCSDPVEDGAGGTHLFCNNTCVASACGDVFWGGSFQGDFGDFSKFGEVYFQCQAGNMSSDVTGWFEMEAREGSCSMGGDAEVAAAFQTSQLGVWCSNISAYSYDDGMFECNLGSQSVNQDGVYTCTSGKACYGEPCHFALEGIVVVGDRHRLPQDCMSSSTGATVFPPVPVSTSREDSLYTNSSEVTARFQVNSGFFYDEGACEGMVSGMRMTCLNGKATLVENQGVMSCTEVNETTIECSETATAKSTRNEYVGILQYECTSAFRVPRTKVENTGTEIGCVSTTEQEVSVDLQLGAFCGTNAVVYDDYFYECGNEWSNMVSRSGDFTCGATSTFPPNSIVIPALQVLVPSVEIETDYRWGMHASEMSCLTMSDDVEVSASRTSPDLHSILP